MTVKTVRATISIAGIQVEVFHSLSGEYVMSQSQVAEAVGVQSVFILRFLESEEAKALLGRDFGFYTLSVEGSNRPIKVIPINVVSAFWFTQAIKGNIKAQSLSYACQIEALERRCGNAFNVTKTEQQYEQQATQNRERWEQRRNYLREQHTIFEYACKTYGFSCASTHNKLTIAAVKKTAKELKELEVIQGSKDVGLNHIGDSDELLLVAKVKRNFSRYRKGDVDERIHRALKDARKEMNALREAVSN